MKSKKLISALLVLAIAGSAATAVGLTACKKGGGDNGGYSGKVIYVAVDGKEDAAGTKSDPREIASTLRDTTLEPGTTVLVQPGTYELRNRTFINASGEYNKYITFKNADPSKKAVLSFYNMEFLSTNRGVQVYGNYIHWDGIDICGAGDNGMYIGGSYNIVENSEFYDNRDTGLQLGRSYSPSDGLYEEFADINYWPSYNLIKNCTSYNNYDNETYGENADGFAAKLTVGYGNVFDGCVAYRNSDDGWDLFAKVDSGNIGEVIMYNCVAFENGFINETQKEFNAKFPTFTASKREEDDEKYTTRDGDGNGFKLGGSIMEGEVRVYNCLAFNNRMHGVTDNSNPGVITVDKVTSYNNGANVDRSGTVVYTGNGVDEGSANIDLARHAYSYNHVANVLSVNNGNTKISKDAYRGTVENCTFQSQDTKTEEFISYTVSGQAEYNTKTGDNGVRTASAAATTLFKELPTDRLGFDETLHKKWRNADGSLNLGNLLALVDPNGTQGSKLNLTRWEDYPHYDMHDLTKCTSADDAIAQAVIDMAYLPIRVEACYQNFDVVTKIANVPIVWTSSNTDIINITNVRGTSNSKHEDLKVDVIRPIDEDEVVTLTATVTVGDVTKTKTFNVNVKKDTFRVGDITIKDLKGDAIIKDKGDSRFAFRVEAPVVTNGTSNSGRVISTDYYTLNTYTSYATYQDPTNFAQNAQWDARVAGIWKIDLLITLKTDMIELAKAVNGDGLADQIINQSYYIYIADSAAANDFSGESTLAVNRFGYTLTGSFVSPTGYIYSMSKPASESAATVEEIKAAYESGSENVEKQVFRDTAKTFQFKQANSAAYNVYYFLENLDGTEQSNVYTKSVQTQSITSKTSFEAMLSSNNTSTVYLLANDIDMNNQEVAVSETQFVGVFNGNGHTISNFRVTTSDKDVKQFGLFRNVVGGTIMNVNFENGYIRDSAGKSERTGIIGQMEGGYIYNVKVHNLDVNIDYFVEGTKIKTVDLVDGKVNDNGFREVTIGEGDSAVTKYYDKNGDEVDADGKKIGSTENGVPYSKTELADGEIGGKTYEGGFLVEGGKKFDKDGDEVDDEGFKLDKNGDKVPKRVSSRVGGLIGQVGVEHANDGARSYIERVSVTSDKDEKGNYLHVIRGDQRVGAIIGYIQAGNAAKWTKTYVTDCYVDCLIESNTYGAGIIGRYDDRNKSDVLEIATCYFSGKNYTQKYCGGILGGFSGAGKLYIISAVSSGELWYTDEPYHVYSCEKNCSNMIGYYAANGDATVRNCYANFSEHNGNYEVMPFGYADDEGNVFPTIGQKDEFWLTYLTNYDYPCESSTIWDFENVWELVNDEPYAKLR